jgi:heme-degrading monooxygenase HmoA
MIVVIFEVEPAEGHFDEYLDHAARLRPALEKMPGFISIERFGSLTNPNPQKLLRLSFCESEEAVAGWRCHAMHRALQTAGFRDFGRKADRPLSAILC